MRRSSGRTASRPVPRSTRTTSLGLFSEMALRATLDRSRLPPIAPASSRRRRPSEARPLRLARSPPIRTHRRDRGSSSRSFSTKRRDRRRCSGRSRAARAPPRRASGAPRLRGPDAPASAPGSCSSATGISGPTSLAHSSRMQLRSSPSPPAQFSWSQGDGRSMGIRRPEARFSTARRDQAQDVLEDRLGLFDRGPIGARPIDPSLENLLGAGLREAQQARRGFLLRPSPSIRSTPSFRPNSHGAALPADAGFFLPRRDNLATPPQTGRLGEHLPAGA